MSDTIRTRIVRDLDDPDGPAARVETIGDLVLLEVRVGTSPPESILVHPHAARYLAAGLVLAAWEAERVALAARLDREGETKGGLL